jgi:hypothetical protein
LALAIDGAGLGYGEAGGYLGDLPTGAAPDDEADHGGNCGRASKADQGRYDLHEHLGQMMRQPESPMTM